MTGRLNISSRQLPDLYNIMKRLKTDYTMNEWPCTLLAITANTVTDYTAINSVTHHTGMCAVLFKTHYRDGASLQAKQ